MTLVIYIKRAIICIQSRNSKIDGFEATELQTLSVNVYQMKKARERVDAGILNNKFDRVLWHCCVIHFGGAFV